MYVQKLLRIQSFDTLFKDFNQTYVSVEMRADLRVPDDKSAEEEESAPEVGLETKRGNIQKKYVWEGRDFILNR